MSDDIFPILSINYCKFAIMFYSFISLPRQAEYRDRSLCHSLCDHGNSRTH